MYIDKTLAVIKKIAKIKTPHLFFERGMLFDNMQITYKLSYDYEDIRWYIYQHHRFFDNSI